MSSKTVAWSVVGAGPGGLTAVGMLLDTGVRGEDIVWIDPDFQVGDFGKYWGEVNSNTKVQLFRQFLEGVRSFDYQHRPKKFALDERADDQFTLLKWVTEPLLWVTEQLKNKVVTKKSEVKSLAVSDGTWQLTLKTGEKILSEKVILAIGSDEKSLDFPSVEKINLADALTPSRLKNMCKPEDVVAVFGSSHSAMIAVRNLVEAGVKQINNFYLSPLRFAVPFEDWILYDDTGLKGETAVWVHENVSQQCLPQICRYVANEENLDEFLPNCTKAVYAVGFQQRHLPISGVHLSNYDPFNGIIAPGLFGVGIAFPIIVRDPFDRQEANVGLWKFLKNMRRTLPVWQRYGL